MDDFSKQLMDLLVAGSFITLDDATEIQKQSAEYQKDVQELLVEKELLTEAQLGQIVADLHGWKFVDLTHESIDENILRQIPEEIAKSQQVIAYARTDEGVKVAMKDPDDISLIHFLQKSLGGVAILSYYTTPQSIQRSLYHYAKELNSELQELMSQQHSTGANNSDDVAVKMVNLLLSDGYKKRASDIHIEPMREETLIRFRIDGVMQDIVRIPFTLHELIITRIKIMSRLRTDEHQMPQDGKFQFPFEGESVDVRVSILPTNKGENVVMRLLSEKSRRYSLEDLGLAKRDYDVLHENIKKPWGMILATGPTGSGKTTSLYAILKILNRREVNIATIEDPVEYNVDTITQIQVNPRTNLTFASGLRSIVRQDPNIVMVGEIRDEETASIAVNSAMTGHLVLSTLHTNDAATTLPRLLDMGIAPFLISSTVNISIAQRLVRKICSQCIMSYEAKKEELLKHLPHQAVEALCKDKDSVLLYKGAGCNVCHHSGYNGRLGVFEILEVNDDIRELIMKNADAETIKKKAIENGMVTMFEDAIEKVHNGVTTVEEMLRVVKY